MKRYNREKTAVNAVHKVVCPSSDLSSDGKFCLTGDLAICKGLKYWISALVKCSQYS